MSTPHNSAQLGDFAKTCLMPGDPLRAKFIAENYLENPRLVNNVRGAQGYTGLYKNVPVSVMASGMGMPSMGIHSYELFAYYGVENILRIGSAGAISQNLQLHDIVAGMGACTNSNYMQQFSLPGSYAPICSYDLLTQAVQAAGAIGVDLKVGNLLSSDTFYDVSESTLRWGKLGVLAVEMEAASLYANAAYFGKRALAICSITDHVITGENLPSDERRKGLNKMIRIALDVACAIG